MADSRSTGYRFRWKWVWITLGMFTLLYLLPLTIASTVPGELGLKIIGGWMFGGVIVVSGLAGYFSKDVTIWEPAIAGGFVTILSYAGIEIINVLRGFPLRLELGQLAILLIAVFGLSLLGAGLGEGIQNAATKMRQADVSRMAGTEEQRE
ncbi:MAG: hypothetical protein HBSIN02_11630 [Bacteroidia bacterium]|nr:MAG: hypothetical protein HBSIN02_11630 [Bacteroidia bacterium]